MKTKLRREEDHIHIAIPSDEFDQKLQEYLDADDFSSIKSLYDGITYHRDELPESESLGTSRLWWLLGVLAALVFLFGLIHLIWMLIRPLLHL